MDPTKKEKEVIITHALDNNLFRAKEDTYNSVKKPV